MAALLANLPSRGLLVNFAFDNPLIKQKIEPSTYICSHNTDPPANQVIRTDPTNILIRNLTKRRQQTKRSRSDGKEADSSAQTSATPIDTASHANSTSSLSSRPLTRSNSSKPTNNHNHTVSACSSNSSSTANSRLKRRKDEQHSVANKRARKHDKLLELPITRLNTLNKTQLVELLREAKLPCSGSKPELLSRIREYRRQNR